MKNTMEMNKLNMDEIEMVNGGTGPIDETGPIGTCDPPCKTGSFDTTGPVDTTVPCLSFDQGY